MYTIISPLRVPVTKTKFFVLNLNDYRNRHYQVLNKAKVAYKDLLSDQIRQLPSFEHIGLMLTLYTKDARLTDVSNVCSIHEKFFADALVELGKLPDDNYQHLPETGYRFGGIDRQNPRVEISIHPLQR